ncbi:hypothetical protein H8D36_06980 [archaeon]|nr:hypothetical protein [archaeon]
MRTILFQKVLDNSEYGNQVSFSEGVMTHKQIEQRNGLVFMRIKKRRLIS